MHLNALQCSSPGVAECLLNAPTANARSGRVASITYMIAPSALWIHWHCDWSCVLHVETFEYTFDISLLQQFDCSLLPVAYDLYP